MRIHGRSYFEFVYVLTSTEDIHVGFGREKGNMISRIFLPESTKRR